MFCFSYVTPILSRVEVYMYCLNISPHLDKIRGRFYNSNAGLNSGNLVQNCSIMVHELKHLFIIMITDSSRKQGLL